jgi:hypothetical protein
MASPNMNGMTDDVSTGVKKQEMPARIISIPRITNSVFLAVITIHPPSEKSSTIVYSPFPK